MQNNDEVYRLYEGEIFRYDAGSWEKTGAYPEDERVVGIAKETVLKKFKKMEWNM